MATPSGTSLPLLLVILGIGLSIAEALAPGAHFVVVGVALLVAGIVGLLVPALSGALALAALVLISGAASLYVYREFDLYGGSGAGATSDSDSLKGRSGRVTERVTETGGEIKLDGGGFNPYYSARTIDGEIPEGTEVMVVDPGGGNVLTVEPLGAIEDDIDRELARGRDRERARENAETEGA
jgi:membrane protein implicated in regulation of membrane protease activity